MPDARIDPLDIGALERSVNDSAARVSGIWLSFVAFSAYLAAAASMISHRQIFLEEPIRLPTINIDLPLVASAVLLPLLFVIYHVFVLLQVVLLARTADAYNEAIEHSGLDAGDSIRVRQRLANTLFAQLFAGSRREREGLLGWLLRLMAWITLAIAPVCVLIIFEIKFLPYHSAALTWTHRALIAIDLLAVLLLWAAAVEPRRDITWRSLGAHRTIAAGAVVILLLCNMLLTFPGEPGRAWMKLVSPSDKTAGDIAQCQTAGLAIVAPGFDRLVLLGEDFVDDERLAKIIATAKTSGQARYESERTRSFRRRDLRCARLAGTDLRHADFSEADLSGATLKSAELMGALFAGANLAEATLDSAQLQDSSFVEPSRVADASGKPTLIAQLPNASLRGAQLDRANLKNANLKSADLSGAQLNNANLSDADLEAADLRSAQLENASLESADLRGASFDSARMKGAHLDGATLQAASFRGAQMQQTSLDFAEMQGAALDGAQMTGASLDHAKLHGAVFYGTHLDATTFYQSELQGALFKRTQFGATVFIEAQMQGIETEGGTVLRDSIVKDSFLWRAGRVLCNFTHVVAPNFDEIIEVHYPHGPTGFRQYVTADDQAISDFIARSVEKVPDKPRFEQNISKDQLQQDLKARLRASGSASPADESWKACFAESQGRTPEGFQELATHIVDHACGVADINSIVNAFAGDGSRWVSELADVPVGKLFAKSLLAADTQQCSNIKGLTDSSRALLQRLID